MDKKKVAILNLKHAVHEADFLLDKLLELYESIKSSSHFQDSELGEVSYLFNAFVRSGKSALELIGKTSSEGKKEYLDNFEKAYGQNYLMKSARDLVTHGSGNLIPGWIEVDNNGEITIALVCAPLNEGGMAWIRPPSQDSISLAIDYFLGILSETEKLYESLRALPESYWHGIRDWELEGMKASIHISPEIIELAKHACQALPQGLVPDLIDTSWVGRMAIKYKSLRAKMYPAIKFPEKPAEYAS